MEFISTSFEVFGVFAFIAVVVYGSYSVLTKLAKSIKETLNKD